LVGIKYLKCPYGPSKPHFGQRYGRPNFLQREHRHITISPQLGHGNFVASAPGAIILWHEVHTGTVTVVAGFSLIWGSSVRIGRIVNVGQAYIGYVRVYA
jgi:hypothetical protein